MSRQLHWVGVTWIACSACQTLLSLERAQVDPELATESSVTSDGDTVETKNEGTSAVIRRSDAGDSGSDSSEAPQCEGFDNARVELLNADGTLPPLPEVAPEPPIN